MKAMRTTMNHQTLVRVRVVLSTVQTIGWCMSALLLILLLTASPITTMVLLADAADSYLPTSRVLSSRHQKVAFVVAGYDHTIPSTLYHRWSRRMTTTTSFSSSSSSNHRYYSCSSGTSSITIHPMFGRKSSSSTSRLRMSSWGPEPTWTSATIVGVPQKACLSGRSWSFTVQVPMDVSNGYTIPGQYVQIRLANMNDNDKGDEGGVLVAVPTPSPKPIFLAIASAPNPSSNQLEFLIKRTTTNGWFIDPLIASSGSQQSIPLPTNIEISQVMGRGYAIQENLNGYKYDFPTQNILLFATGSGIAPIKAAMESGQLLGGSSSRTIRLYYGERHQEDLCYINQFAQWENAGIEVVPVLSRPNMNNNMDDSSSDIPKPTKSSPSTVWLGRTGYVQNALEEDGVGIPRNSAALLCGMKGMTDAVKNLLQQAGVFEGRILLNF